MKSSFITSVPDKSGAFLKAVKIFSSRKLNIIRTSYNKSVDSHLIFLEVEGEEEEIEKAIERGEANEVDGKKQQEVTEAKEEKKFKKEEIFRTRLCLLMTLVNVISVNGKL